MSVEPPAPRGEFSYRADLSLQPLPELLFTISQYKVPGVITFTNKQASKKLFIKDGRIIFAASNLKDDELGEFLFRCGKVSRQQLDQSNRQLRKWKGRRQGQILVQMNALRADELPWAVRSHQQMIIWSVFNWFEGTMEFNLGSFKENEPIQMDLMIQRAILDGVRNIYQAKRVIRYIGEKESILIKDETALLSLEMYEGDEKEREILNLVNGQNTLYQLCSKSPYGPHETAKILYGLWVLKLVQRKQEGSTGVKIVSRIGSSRF